MNLFVRSVCPAVICIGICGCTQHRELLSESALQKTRQELVQTRIQRQSESAAIIVERLRREYDAHAANPASEPATLDILFLSGGADYGAFGAGVLKGWGRVPSGPMARPKFDVVMGCSTGALIAPFAYLGSDADYERIEAVYREPKSDWIRPRGVFFFLPSNESFATIPGLERDLRALIDRPFVERIAVEARTGRLLCVNTTNLDDGSPTLIELSKEAEPALATGNLERLYGFILSSASVPGVFPPRMIDSALYVDGGISSPPMYFGGFKLEQSIPCTWRRRYADLPMPKTRYWVIINSQLHLIPRTVKRTWPEIISRTVDVATCSATLTAMRHLSALAALSSATDHAEVEIRFVAIPDEWRPRKPGLFLKETMNDLADLGERLGAETSSWQTEIP
jgi:hypothetical protein